MQEKKWKKQKMKKRRIIWKMEKDGSVYAFNRMREYLGALVYERVGAHMHWCWYQHSSIRMSPGCLQEVREKQKELFDRRN